MKRRLFFAIPIKISNSLAQSVKSIKNALVDENIHWINQANYHLTLKFIGETEENQIPLIIEAVKNCTSYPLPYTLIINRIGVFGAQYKPRVIWAGGADLGETMLLRKNILENIKTIGFMSDRQNFIPHISLARMEKLYDLKRFQSIMQQIGEIKPEKIEVKNFDLYESILKPEGPVYNVLHTISL